MSPSKATAQHTERGFYFDISLLPFASSITGKQASRCHSFTCTTPLTAFGLRTRTAPKSSPQPVLGVTAPRRGVKVTDSPAPSCIWMTGAPSVLPHNATTHTSPSAPWWGFFYVKGHPGLTTGRWHHQHTFWSNATVNSGWVVENWMLTVYPCVLVT